MNYIERLDSKQQIKGFLGAVPVCGLLSICLEVGLAFLHRGGSVKNHLIHFAILLLMAEGMVLLFGAVPSLRQIWARIDRRILSAETRKPWVDYLYTGIAIAMLLHHFYVLLYYPSLPAGASRFAPVWIPFAVVSTLMGKLWRDKGFWISAILAAYLFERTYLKESNLSGETMVYMVSAIYALIVCYGVFHVVQIQHRHGMLQVLCALWTLLTIFLCGVGLYVAWTGKTIQNLAQFETYIVVGRLHLFSAPTISGGIIAGGAMVALIGFASSHNIFGKVLYILACFIMMVTNALTDARSCMLMLAFFMASMTALGTWGVLKKTGKVYKSRNIMLALGLAVIFAGCFFFMLKMQQQMTGWFVTIRDRGGVVVATAQAESPVETSDPTAPPPSFIDRSLATLDSNETDELLNGRKEIWESALSYLKNHSESLIFGLSTDGSVKTIINRDDHCHNIVIQMLMEGGIIGLGLFLGLLGYFFFHACRLWRKWDLPLWQRALPVPALAVLMMEMVECLTHFAYGHVPMTVLYFFIGATVAVSKGMEKKTDLTE